MLNSGQKYILVNLFCANQNLLCKKNNGYFYFILWQNSSFECGVFLKQRYSLIQDICCESSVEKRDSFGYN